MKKILFAIAVVIGSSSTLWAQTSMTPNQNMQRATPSPEDIAQRQTDKMNKMLDLNADQKQKVYKINLTYIQQLQSAKQNNDRTAFNTARQSREAALKQTLTQEQFQKMEPYMGRQKQMMMKNGQNMNQPNTSQSISK